jgi:hypothetical protein
MSANPRTERWLASYVSIPAACREMLPGITPYSLHRVCDRGEIPYVMSGRVRKVKRGDVLEWERSQREDTQPVPVLATVSGFDPLRD